MNEQLLTHLAVEEMAAILAYDISKGILLKEKLRILIEISLKFVSKGPIDNNPALVQIMAWRRIGEDDYLNQCSHICGTRADDHHH